MHIRKADLHWYKEICF